VEAQGQADATPVPKLSQQAQTAMTALATATDEKTQVALWRGMTSDKTIDAEVGQFTAAVQQLFGDDTVRAMYPQGRRVRYCSPVRNRAAGPAPGALIPARTEAAGDSRRRRSVAPRGSST
jgi:hypothetical protein